MFEVRKVNKDGSVSKRKVSKANTFPTMEEAFSKVKELDGDWVVVGLTEPPRLEPHLTKVGIIEECLGDELLEKIDTPPGKTVDEVPILKIGRLDIDGNFDFRRAESQIKPGEAGYLESCDIDPLDAFDDTPKTLAEAGLTTFEEHRAVAAAEESGLLKLEAPTPQGLSRFTRDPLEAFDGTPNTVEQAGVEPGEAVYLEAAGFIEAVGDGRFIKPEPFLLSEAKHVLGLSMKEREAARAGKLVFFGGPSWRRAIWRGNSWKARACTPEEWEMI